MAEGSYAPALFFPALLLIIGAHDLLLISLYGAKAYAVIADALVLLETLATFFVPALGPFSGWIGAGVFAVFVPILYHPSTVSEFSRT